MALRLSTDEVGRLQHALTVLLSPLDYATPEVWGDAACGAVRSLLDAHQSSLFITGAEPDLWFTTMEEATTRDFLAHYAGVDPVSSRVIARGIECACAWDVVERDQFHDSEFFNDFAGPHGLHDAMGMRIPEGPNGHFWLTIQHDRPLPEPQVRRRVALMQLVLPAFKAGARFATSAALRETELARLLDQLAQAIVVASIDGRVLHRNAAMERLLEETPGAAISDELRRMLLALSALRVPADPAPQDLLREVDIGGRCLRLSGSLVEEGVLGPDPLLLAERRTNREVAEALHISPHTAERHTERVLSKLGVPSRLQVPARLAGR